VTFFIYYAVIELLFVAFVGADFGLFAGFGRVSKLQAVTAFQWAWSMWSNFNSLVSYHHGFG